VGASLNNGMISMLGFLAANYLATGEQPRRAGNDHAIVSPNGMFRTADGEVAIAPSSEKLNAAGVPCDRIMTLREVFADPQVQSQEMVLSAEHPGHGEVKMLGFPIKFSEAPCRIRRPAPDLGAHTDAILSEIGYAPEEISRLREDAIV